MLRFNRYSPILDRRFDIRRPIRNERSVEIYFGKVGWYNPKRKCNAITVEVRWGEEDSSFSVCANIWNQRGTDIICGGQCLDEINDRHIDFGEQGNKAWAVIYRLWKLYHLNTMRAGTKEQAEFLASNKEYQKDYDYNTACRVLKEAGLYEVPHPEKPGEMFKYGHGWLTWDIPAEDRELINKLFAV